PGLLPAGGNLARAGDGARARAGSRRGARARERTAADGQPLRTWRQGSGPCSRGDRAALPGRTDVRHPQGVRRCILGGIAALAVLVGCASAPSTPAPAVATVGGPDAGTPVSVSTPPPGLRLPTDVRPTSERLSLRLDPRATTFTGTARIQLIVGAAVPSFWIHAQDLTIRRASLVQAGAERPVRTVVSPPDLLQIVPGTA